MRWGILRGCVIVAWAVGCSSSSQDAPAAGAGGASTGAGGQGFTSSSSGAGGNVASSSSSSSGNTSSSSSSGGGAGSGGGNQGTGGGGGAGPAYVDTLVSNRDRLLETYFEFLKASATTPQSNGLSGSNVSSVCDVWSKLDPSSQGVFLTLTERLQASILGVDGSSMLWHVKTIYRITGGQGATQADPGSCGGGEYNRMIMSMDAELQASQAAANTHQGAKQANSKYDIADAPAKGTFWRDSHDAAGPHAPFDLSDETDQGAPRGQTQYFKDPASGVAKAPLGRQDLTTLVDPYALEMDQDYDCIHNSNPLCSYITYGQFCIPGPSTLGTKLFTDSYGDDVPSWKPAGCP